MGLSFYGLRALQTETMHLRIAEMTVACTLNVTMKEAERVVAGNLLPPRRQAAMRAARLCFGFEELDEGRPGRISRGWPSWTTSCKPASTRADSWCIANR